MKLDKVADLSSGEWVGSFVEEEGDGFVEKAGETHGEEGDGFGCAGVVDWESPAEDFSGRLEGEEVTGGNSEKSG